MFKRPQIGQEIAVTVRKYDNYLYAKEKVTSQTYVGRVLKPYPWLRDDQFCLSSTCEFHPIRVISLNNVIDITHGEVQVENTTTIEVPGSKGNTYIVTVVDGNRTSCTCPGFTYRQTCRHVTGAVDHKTTKAYNKTVKSKTETQQTKRSTTMSNKSLSWNDRFALMDHYNPSDAQACQAFGVTQDELDTARSMRQCGAFKATPGVDVESYKSMFEDERGSSTVTSTSRSTKKKDAAPVTATKKTKEPKKRGRKGNKIVTAFASVPNTPVPVDVFAAEHGVSVAVLRQPKRFNPEGGEQIKVRKDKSTNTLMIWRESN